MWQPGEPEAAVARGEESIRRSAPELLELRLPAHLEQKFLEVASPDSFTDYALGVYQGGAGTAEDATAAAPVSLTVRFSGGTFLDNPYSRFVTASPGDSNDVIIQGHYGNPEIGRYVYVFPVEKDAVDTVGGGSTRGVAVHPSCLEVIREAPILHLLIPPVVIKIRLTLSCM